MYHRVSVPLPLRVYSSECVEEGFTEIGVEYWSSRVHKGAAPVES